MSDTLVSSSHDFRGRWLLFVRILWVIFFVICVGTMLAAASGHYIKWYPVINACSAAPLEEQAACSATQQALGQLNLPINFLAIYFSIAVIIQTVPWFFVGLVIFLKKAHKPFEYFFSLMLVISGTYTFDDSIPFVAMDAYPVFYPIFHTMRFLGSSLLIFWYGFPDGRVQRWMRWLALGWVLIRINASLDPKSPLAFDNWPFPLPMLITVGFVASFIVAFVYRYRHTSNEQHQQIKWVVSSASIFAFIYIVIELVKSFIPAVLEAGVPQIIWWLISTPLLMLASLVVAVSIGFSILRYRLWDIDFLINRSLVYGTLTVLLLMVFGGTLALVSLFVQGQSFIIAFGLTAILAIVLFNPVRRLIQRFVDQNFYHIYIDYQKAPRSISAPAKTNLKTALHETHFGVYQGLEIIGRGGMAEVYKSVHPTLGVTVAIKILPTSLAEQDHFRKRFVHEGQLVSQFDHPNIVTVFDAGEQDGTHYIVMEYLLGKDLNDLLKRNGKLSLNDVLPLLNQIAEALDYVHLHGIVHRDIKPSNIMLDKPVEEGARAVLTDFGIAKMVNGNNLVTDTDELIGTLDYIAPEQIQGQENIDGKADIYALGVMIYQMLAGELPFKHSNPGALLIAHLTQPPPNLCDSVPEIPAHVAFAVERAMSKKPDQRFATAKEFAMALTTL